MDGKRNPILTIALPTYNAGHRALEFVRHCLQSDFDETEIELLVSENCSNTNREPYQEIKKISDPRLVYMESDQPLFFYGNFLKIMEHARGRYIHTMSNDDLVNLACLPWILETVRDPRYAVIIGCIPRNAYKYYGLKGLISNNGSILYPAGPRAIIGAFTSVGLYMSHYILNRDIYFSSGTHAYIQAHIEDSLLCRIFPSIMACILFAGLYGDIYCVNQEFFIKGHDEPTTVGGHEVGGKGYGHPEGWTILFCDSVEILTGHYLQRTFSYQDLCQCIFSVYTNMIGVLLTYWHCSKKGWDIYRCLPGEIERFVGELGKTLQKHSIPFSKQLEANMRQHFQKVTNEYIYMKTKTFISPLYASVREPERIQYK